MMCIVPSTLYREWQRMIAKVNMLKCTVAFLIFGYTIQRISTKDYIYFIVSNHIKRLNIIAL